MVAEKPEVLKSQVLDKTESKSQHGCIYIFRVPFLNAPTTDALGSNRKSNTVAKKPELLKY